jgi:hypothetical protein
LQMVRELPDYPAAFMDGGCNRRRTSIIAGETSVW